MNDQSQSARADDKSTLKSFAKKRRASLVGAIFLMATSAIGPGFITQTATFTVALGASFAFGILLSILIDLAIQLNVWRVVTTAGKTASQLANEGIRGSGYLLAALVIIGGVVFNVGNVAGAGLGLNALLGLDPRLGGAISALLAIAIFIFRRAGAVVDVVIVLLGVVMIVMTLWVAVVSQPPLGDALRQSVIPDEFSFAAVTTIVGGTVGGYITYAGAHRLLDAGFKGEEHTREVMRSASMGIIVTGIMRYVLFLAVLGVVASGVVIDTAGGAANPAGQAFQAVLGEAGLRIFGLVFWAAAITSVIGAAYTSVSFFPTFTRNGMSDRARRWATVIFITGSLVIYLLIGAAPATLLVFAGGFNGLVLPIGMTLFMYIVVFRRKKVLGTSAYPIALVIIGVIGAVLSWVIAVPSVGPIFELLFA